MALSYECLSTESCRYVDVVKANYYILTGMLIEQEKNSCVKWGALALQMFFRSR